jgi:predicted ribosome quality control (RQC) complex YloA/Tae2 family protein
VDNFYLAALLDEVSPEVLGRTVARIWLEGTAIRMDLRLASGRQLLVSLDRVTPAFYLSRLGIQNSRAEQQGPGFFLSLLRKHILDARLVNLRKDARDRVVYLDFERLDAGDRVVKVTLRLALTGRSANAALQDAEGNVIVKLFDHETALDPSGRLQSSEQIDLVAVAAELDTHATEPEILASFGSESGFGPQLRHEFQARIKNATPSMAFKSLVDDLVNRDPLPLIYSRLPLEKLDEVVIDPSHDLILSHIELAQAQGMIRFQFSSLSEAADQYYSSRARAVLLRAEYNAFKQKLSREIKKWNAVIRALESDRLRFGDPEQLKRFGDLLLANLANARVQGSSAIVVDYYDPAQPEIQIEIPDGSTLKEAASDYFSRFQKARRALAAIASRQTDISRKLARLQELLSKLETEPTSSRIEATKKSFEQLFGAGKQTGRGKGPRPKRKTIERIGRRFRSTDGYEIVVGRNDRDNDIITFRVARPHDIWLHAADYPGSHAIVRNPNRDTLPHRTITEAAELVAYYSQAKREGKAAVHYAERKFVSKPPRAKPGLVRLSSFKTIIVEPRCELERLE